MAQLNAHYVYKSKRVDILTVVGTTFDISTSIHLVECGNFANTSGTVLTLTLPAALPGRYHEVHVTSDDAVKLTPQSGEKVAISTGVMQIADAEVECSTAGASIRLQCIDKGEWACVGSVGSWTLTT